MAGPIGPAALLALSPDGRQGVFSAGVRNRGGIKVFADGKGTQAWTRREETAVLRSQANTAKPLAKNPTLMRLRELEVLEKIIANGNLKIVLGEKSLADRVMNLI